MMNILTHSARTQAQNHSLMSKHSKGKRCASLILASALLFGVGPSFAGTLMFDDISTSSFTPVPVGYGGFQWGNFYAINKNYLPASGYHNGNVSPENSIFDGFGNPAQVSRTTAFDLVSAYMTSAWIDQEVEVVGYLGATKLYDQTYSLNTLTPLLVNFNYVGVDNVTFTPLGSSPTGIEFVIDDMTLNNSSASVPDTGATAALLGGAILGLGLLRRKDLVPVRTQQGSKR